VSSFAGEFGEKPGEKQVSSGKKQVSFMTNSPALNQSESRF
jgi:hypothetical protein